jgi:Cu+-exporting ATPase
MSGADITVLVFSVMAVAGLGWYFFAPRKGRVAAPGDGVQKIAVTVRGGYSPNLIHVRQGVPEIESMAGVRECTNRVVFADLSVNAAYPPTKTSPANARPGRNVGFACGMNMIHGPSSTRPTRPPQRRSGLFGYRRRRWGGAAEPRPQTWLSGERRSPTLPVAW